MHMEELAAYLNTPVNVPPTTVGVFAGFVLLLLVVLYQGYKLNTPNREKAKMDKEREKAFRTKVANYIFWSLKTAVKDGELPVPETADILRQIGKRVLPEIFPNGALSLKEELQEKHNEEGKTEVKQLPAFLTRFKFKSA